MLFAKTSILLSIRKLHTDNFLGGGLVHQIYSRPNGSAMPGPARADGGKMPGQPYTVLSAVGEGISQSGESELDVFGKRMSGERAAPVFRNLPGEIPPVGG